MIKEVTSFFADFENRSKQAPLVQRKELIKKGVAMIEIDPERSAARCYVRQIPIINAEI